MINPSGTKPSWPPDPEQRARTVIALLHHAIGHYHAPLDAPISLHPFADLEPGIASVRIQDIELLALVDEVGPHGQSPREALAMLSSPSLTKGLVLVYLSDSLFAGVYACGDIGVGNGTYNDKEL